MRTQKDPRRYRTIRWRVTTDEIAKAMAHQRMMDGGVSELVETLVLDEHLSETEKRRRK